LNLQHAFAPYVRLEHSFRQEISDGAHASVAVRRMIRFAGRVVLVSGLTLAVTFLALVFFPFCMSARSAIFHVKSVPHI
jgi:uncharacterized membrane protein YdfJ with MMPL/SSD domain